LGVLESLTKDDLEFFKKFSLTTLEQLLQATEMEKQRIIEIIINKLGDTDKKVQCHAIFVLTKILKTSIKKESALPELLLKEIQVFMGRPGTKPQARFYAIAVLNKIASFIGKQDEKIRIALLKHYFSLFRKMIEDKQLEEENNKIAVGVLKGLNILLTAMAKEKLS